MAPGPWYLPGGTAMVRQIGGDEKFVTDADECCCQSTTTTTASTTTAGPGTTTAPGESRCPYEYHCRNNCAGTYYITGVQTGLCGLCGGELLYCDGDYTLVPAPWNDCQWSSVPEWGGSEPYCCRASITCADPDTEDPYWRILLGNAGAYPRCQWTKRAWGNSCPEGNYTLSIGYPNSCYDCEETLTVYS